MAGKRLYDIAVILPAFPDVIHEWVSIYMEKDISSHVSIGLCHLSFLIIISCQSRRPLHWRTTTGDLREFVSGQRTGWAQRRFPISALPLSREHPGGGGGSQRFAYLANVVRSDAGEFADPITFVQMGEHPPRYLNRRQPISFVGHCSVSFDGVGHGSFPNFFTTLRLPSVALRRTHASASSGDGCVLENPHCTQKGNHHRRH